MQRVTIAGDSVFGLVDETAPAAGRGFGRSADAARNDGGVVRQFARRKS